METKKFKCKDEVIYRAKNEDYEWTYGVFSHYYKENEKDVAVINGIHFFLLLFDILPYEGNEHLVGTDLPADEEIRLEEGEWVFSVHAINCDTEDWMFGKFIEITYDSKIGTDFSSYDYTVKFSDFNPNDMEETRKHILVVKNGKIVRYKG